MRNWLIIAVMVVLCFASVAAQEDFSLDSEVSYTLCPCSGQGYPILITNTGSVTSTYTVYTDQATADLVSFAPAQTTLEPGTATYVFAYVTSSCEQVDPFALNVYVQTENGAARGIQNTLSFDQTCYDFSLEPGAAVDIAFNQSDVRFVATQEDYSFCTERSVTIPVLVENRDPTFENVYTLSTSAPFATVRPAQVTVANGTSGVVLVDVNTPSLGNASFTLTAESALGKRTQELFIEAESISCYGLSFDLEHPDTLCSGSGHNIFFSLSNNGAFEERVRTTIEGKEWGWINDTPFSIGAGQTVERRVYLDPEAKVSGEHAFTLTAQSTENATVRATQALSSSFFALETCYDLDIDSQQKHFNTYAISYIPVVLRNDGKFPTSFDLSFEGPEWIALDHSQVSINPEQHYTFNMVVDPGQDVEEGTYPITLLITEDNAEYTVEYTITLSRSAKD